MLCPTCGIVVNPVDSTHTHKELVKRYVIRFDSISDEDLTLLGLKYKCEDGHIQLDLVQGSELELLVKKVAQKYSTVVIREYSLSNDFVKER